jgi:DNA uptake protein ComE-like DNA-binding protein
MKRTTKSRRWTRWAGGAMAALFVAAAAPVRVDGADKLNINTAGEQELMKLPEMNEARAKAIVGYRKSTGEFIQIDELELIPQVKPIFGKIKDLVTVE